MRKIQYYSNKITSAIDTEIDPKIFLTIQLFSVCFNKVTVWEWFWRGREIKGAGSLPEESIEIVYIRGNESVNAN